MVNRNNVQCEQRSLLWSSVRITTVFFCVPVDMQRLISQTFSVCVSDPHSSHWFTAQPLEGATLQSMLTRILAVREAQQERKAAQRRASVTTRDKSSQWYKAALSLYLKHSQWNETVHTHISRLWLRLTALWGQASHVWSRGAMKWWSCHKVICSYLSGHLMQWGK